MDHTLVSSSSDGNTRKGSAVAIVPSNSSNAQKENAQKRILLFGFEFYNQKIKKERKKRIW
jgi:hypothetical protein